MRFSTSGSNNIRPNAPLGLASVGCSFRQAVPNLHCPRRKNWQTTCPKQACEYMTKLKLVPAYWPWWWNVQETRSKWALQLTLPNVGNGRFLLPLTISFSTLLTFLPNHFRYFTIHLKAHVKTSPIDGWGLFFNWSGWTGSVKSVYLP